MRKEQDIIDELCIKFSNLGWEVVKEERHSIGRGLKNISIDISLYDNGKRCGIVEVISEERLKSPEGAVGVFEKVNTYREVLNPEMAIITNGFEYNVIYKDGGRCTYTIPISVDEYWRMKRLRMYSRKLAEMIKKGSNDE